MTNQYFLENGKKLTNKQCKVFDQWHDRGYLVTIGEGNALGDVLAYFDLPFEARQKKPYSQVMVSISKHGTIKLQDNKM